MTQSDFIGLVNGKPWANRACSFEQMDCWGLVVLYYRHVLGLELHHIAGYESGADFITCYEQETRPLAACAGGGNRLHRRFLPRRSAGAYRCDDQPG